MILLFWSKMIPCPLNSLFIFYVFPLLFRHFHPLAVGLRLCSVPVSHVRVYSHSGVLRTPLSVPLLPSACRRLVSCVLYSSSPRSVRRISVPSAAGFPLGSPSPPFFSRSPLSRCENYLVRLKDRRARTYPHFSSYSLSQLLLRSAVSLLTATCVSFPMDPSVLKIRGVTF